MNSVRRKIRKNMPDRAGFSLVEIMVVIVVIGLIAGISAPPMIKYLASSQLQTSSDRMVADLQFARTIAISNGTILRFSTTSSGYILRNPVTDVTLRSREFSDGMTLDQAQTTDFYPWGMADTRSFKISMGGDSRLINVLPTGMVEVP